MSLQWLDSIVTHRVSWRERSSSIHGEGGVFMQIVSQIHLREKMGTDFMSDENLEAD